ncbi:MAG: AsmA family protein, partial [Gammaproteobacteria bacterium]|nr:AsmA family protein [Gammaproteobacteria bacterium]
MKKWSVVIVLGVVIAALIVGLVMLPRYINRLKPEIEQLVQQATGRSFRLDGDLRMSWFPSIGIELGATQLGNAPDFGDTPFAEVDQAILRVAMIPLLSGEIDVRKLQLKGLKLNLLVDEQGRGNWQDLSSASGSNGNAPAEPGPHPLALSLAGIEVEDAALNWHDLSSGEQLSIAPFSFSAGAVVIGQPVDLELQFAINSKAPVFGGQIHLKANVLYEPQSEQIRFQEMALGVTDVIADGLPFTEVQGRVDGAVIMDVKNQLLELSSIHAALQGKHLEGPQVQLDLAVTGALQLETQRYELSDIEITLDVQGEPLGAQGLKATLRSAVVADLQAQNISMAPVQWELKGEPQAGMQINSVLTTDSGRLDLAANQLLLDNIALELNATGGEIGTKGLTGAFNTSLKGDLAAQRFTLEPLELQLQGEPQLDMQTDLALKGRGHLDLPKQQYRIEDAVLNIKAKGGQAPDKGIAGVLKTALHADLEAQSASMNPLHIEAIGMQLDGQLKVQQLLESPHIKGSIKIPPFSPREVLSALDLRIPQNSPKDVLEAGALAADFEASPQGVSVPRLQVALDKTQLDAKLRVEDFAKPDIVFLLNVNTIDVDRYKALLGEQQPSNLPRQEDAGGASEGTIDLPVETLRNMSVKGMVKIDALKVAGMRMKKISATLIGNEGMFEIKPLSLAMYQGHLRSSSKIDVRDSTPAYKLYARVQNIHLGELLKDAVGEESASVEGISTLKMNLSTQGDRPSMLKRQLQGDIDLKLERGKLHDKKFAEKLEALAALV